MFYFSTVLWLGRIVWSPVQTSGHELLKDKSADAKPRSAQGYMVIAL